MELIYTDGCCNNSLSIDGKESIDVNMEDFRKVIHKIVDKIEDFSELQTDWYSFEEQLIVDIIQENCATVYDISIDGNRIEFEDIESISQKDFDFIIKFCNKYNLDIINIDDREDDEFLANK